ncbi:MAG: hypothetical protein CME71_01260 [Halobacteriovorax sp.]|nr:hypothetical protein [Halobacteriovorax sp.]
MKYIWLSLVLLACRDFNYKDQPVVFSSESLELSQLQKTYSFLSKEDFDLKLKSSLDRPLLFFRSFTNTYYADTKVPKQVPLALCLGDAHPENFGFILFKERTDYVFNDLDEAGVCPIALDALRYFTSLRMMGLSQRQTSRYTRYYISKLSKPSSAPRLPSNLLENLEKKRKKNLSKYTEDSRFKAHEDFDLLSQQEKADLLATIKNKLSHLKVFDIISIKKESGGSAGLVRYWVLIEDQNKVRDILELKPRVTAATSFSTDELADYSVVQLAKEIWGELPLHFGEVELNENKYQVRSRSKDDINLTKLNDQEFDIVLKLQLWLMAKHHRLELESVPEQASRWLDYNAELIFKRYNQAYSDLKSQFN